MGDFLWYCEFCRSLPDFSTCSRERKVFERHLDDKICSVKGDPNTLLNKVNSLDKNNLL